MKDDFPNKTTPLPGDERFVNAALEEHARLGSNRNDDALIDRILLETVNRKETTVAIAAVNPTPWKSLVIGVTSAAAVLALGFFFLQSFQLRQSSGQQEEVHFVVRILDESPAMDRVGATTAPTVAAQPSRNPIEPTFAKVDAVVRPISSMANDFLETQFGKSFAQLPEKPQRHDSFLISAAELVQEDNETHFNGDVSIAHDTWKIEAATASVPKAGSAGVDAGERSPSLSAFDVVVTQENPQRTVHAKNLVFDAVTGHLILTGVESISSAEGKMTKFAATDRLTLTETSYAIESLPAVKYASPPLVKPGRN